MEDIVWATIIIWFFLIALGFAMKEKGRIFKGSSAIVGLILMAMFLTENFALALAMFGINIFIMYLAIFEG